MSKYCNRFFLICTLLILLSEIINLFEPLQAQPFAETRVGSSPRLDARGSETFFRSSRNSTSENQNADLNDWAFQNFDQREADRVALEKYVADYRIAGEEFIEYWESLSNIQSTAKQPVQIIFQDQLNGPAAQFADGSIYLTSAIGVRPKNNRQPDLGYNSAAGSPADPVSADSAKLLNRESEIQLRKAILSALLYQKGYNSVFSSELIDNLSDCFAAPGPFPQARLDNANLQETPDTDASRVRFALYGSDGLYAGDFFQLISEKISQNKNFVVYLSGAQAFNEDFSTAAPLSPLERNRNRTPRLPQERFKKRDSIGSDLNDPAPSEQSTDSFTQEVCLETKDVLESSFHREEYDNWRRNPSENSPEIRVSKDLDNLPINQLPPEANQMIVLLKMANRSQVSLLTEEVTPASYNYTNYKESLKPKMVRTLVKSLEQIRRELSRQSTAKNSFILDPGANLIPVRKEKEIDNLFSFRGTQIQVGQDQRGGYLQSSNASGVQYRVRWIEIEQTNSSPANSQTLNVLNRKPVPQAAILLERVAK